MIFFQMSALDAAVKPITVSKSIHGEARMNRRGTLLALLALGAAPAASVAQQRTKVPRIGIIDDHPVMWDAFRKGLRELGYVEGKNIAFEYRYAEGVPERLAKAAKELASLPVDLIAVYGSPPAHAAKEATTTIPIVAIGIGDPVAAKLVASLARPGGNITGNVILGPEVAPKRLQLIKEVIPSVTRVAFLWNPDNGSNVALLEGLQAAAPKLGIKALPVPVRNAGDFDGAFAAMMKERPQALMMSADPLHQRNIGRVLEFLARNRLPAPAGSSRTSTCSGVATVSSRMGGSTHGPAAAQRGTPSDLRRG